MARLLLNWSAAKHGTLRLAWHRRILPFMGARAYSSILLYRTLLSVGPWPTIRVRRWPRVPHNTSSGQAILRSPTSASSCAVVDRRARPIIFTGGADVVWVLVVAPVLRSRFRREDRGGTPLEEHVW